MSENENGNVGLSTNKANNVVARRNPWLLCLLGKLEVLTIRISAAFMVIGLLTGVVFVATNDPSIRQVVFSVSGAVFWLAFYSLVAGTFVLVLLFYDLERRMRSPMFHSTDKLKLLREYYSSPDSSVPGRLNACLCGVLTILVFSAACLVVGLAVSKSFLMG